LIIVALTLVVFSLELQFRLRFRLHVRLSFRLHVRLQIRLLDIEVYFG